MLLTSADDEAGSSATKPDVPTGFGDDRRVIPFFDIRLPKGWAFAPRGDGLLPNPLLSNGYVPAKEEVENDVCLFSDSKESSH